jgi:hypothetical protein
MNKYLLSILLLVSSSVFAENNNPNDYIVNHTNNITTQKHQQMLDFASTNYIDYINELKAKSSKLTNEEQKEVNSLKSFFDQSIKNLCSKKKFDCNYNWNIIFLKDSQEQAFAIYNGTLIFEYNFISKLPKEQQKFVMFHEASHVFLKHSLQEFILANQILGTYKVKDFDPQIIASAIDTKFILPEPLSDLIEKQELEADSLSLILMKSFDVDLEKSMQFVLELKNVKSFMAHSDNKKRKDNIIEKFSLLK